MCFVHLGRILAPQCLPSAMPDAGEGEVHKWKDGWIYGKENGRMDGRTDGQMGRWVGRWMNERMDGWVDR